MAWAMDKVLMGEWRWQMELRQVLRQLTDESAYWGRALAVWASRMPIVTGSSLPLKNEAIIFSFQNYNGKALSVLDRALVLSICFSVHCRAWVFH